MLLFVFGGEILGLLRSRDGGVTRPQAAFGEPLSGTCDHYLTTASRTLDPHGGHANGTRNGPKTTDLRDDNYGGVRAAPGGVHLERWVAGDDRRGRRHGPGRRDRHRRLRDGHGRD